MQKITPFLWFDGQAEEAANFYVSLFPDSKILWKTAGADGKTQWLSFELNGQAFNALNGGPVFKFTEAISFFVNCEGQEEVDKYWNALTANGGSEGQCGWLKDKYGLSWQIIPTALSRLLGDPDHAKAGRVMQAMLKMKKIVIADLEKA
jgi:predicted 3-demethylubiquinone-9 3-methyltransferase (glyoxalase superfamily)